MKTKKLFRSFLPCVKVWCGILLLFFLVVPLARGEEGEAKKEPSSTRREIIPPGQKITAFLTKGIKRIELKEIKPQEEEVITLLPLGRQEIGKKEDEPISFPQGKAVWYPIARGKEGEAKKEPSSTRREIIPPGQKITTFLTKGIKRIELKEIKPDEKKTITLLPLGRQEIEKKEDEPTFPLLVKAVWRPMVFWLILWFFMISGLIFFYLRWRRKK